MLEDLFNEYITQIRPLSDGTGVDLCFYLLLFRQIECATHLLHLLLTHTFGHETHGSCVDINLSTLGENVNLVEGIHHVDTFGKDTMFLPKHHIIVFQLMECGLSERIRSRPVGSNYFCAVRLVSKPWFEVLLNRADW